MPSTPTETPELSGVIRCILRDVACALGVPSDELPGKYTAREAATILDVVPRTMDTWAARADHNDLPFVKVGRSRRYLLTDLVTFIAKRHTDADRYAASAVSSAVCAEVSRLGGPKTADAA